MYIWITHSDFEAYERHKAVYDMQKSHKGVCILCKQVSKIIFWINYADVKVIG